MSENDEIIKHNMEDKPSIPNKLAILPMRDVVIFPHMVIPLMVGRDSSIRLINESLVDHKIIGVVTQKDPEIENPGVEDFFTMGTAVMILKMLKMPDETIRLMVQGIRRINIMNYYQIKPYFQANVEVIEEKIPAGMEIDALVMNIKGLLKKVIELATHLPYDLGVMTINVDEPNRLADLIPAFLSISTEEKQEILQTLDVKKRLEIVTKYLNKELQLLEIGNKIQTQVREEMDKSQREYILREQLKALQKELGEGDEKTIEIQELRQRIKKAKMPEEVQKVAERELDRLAKMPVAASEYTVSRTYLDWLVELPWSVQTQDNLDINSAEKVLDEDHFNLEKVKKRILEFLAVRKLKKDIKGPILCFLGPPGVGKTSLGRSIARALNRKFVRISLGGLRDEAEIRGHRRTYVGALPGRIIQNIRKAGTNNPVFMLDEIDKVGTDFRGDPSSALLEVLDPEQNVAFSDHYLDVDFNLSSVMFITTANLIEPIPPALKDRMEVLELPGYTNEEKLVIAKKYLIPRQLNEHGLTRKHLKFRDTAIKSIIENYTREAGVRNLEREIAAVCRGTAKRVAANEIVKMSITKKNLPEFLGPPKFISDVAMRTSQSGVATGLAWTSVGGSIIFIEATKMPGGKNLILTGQLGDVMKESAQAALSLIRTYSDSLGIEEKFYEKYDVHIHVPAGSVPKDGPSAGITIFIALISLFLDKPVKPDIALTGEITLRGLVLPVGGIKEKVLAAHRAGIKQVVMPDQCEKDLHDVPKQIREELKFHFVKHVKDVVGLVIPNVILKKNAGSKRKNLNRKYTR